MAYELDLQIRSIDFRIIDVALGPAMEMSIIKGFDDNFELNNWTNRNQARQLINEAKGIISANRGTKDNLRPIVSDLYSLLPVINAKGTIDENLLEED